MVKLAHFLTPKRFEQYKNWLPSAAAYGAVFVLGFIYVSDWSLIASKIPIYNRKFKEE